MRILIIDDDRRHGESLGDLLTTRGHEAYYALNYTEARWFAGLFRFDLSVIDFDLPEMAGAEVARRLLKLLPGIEVAIMSARDPAVLRGEIPGLPFFQKPIQIPSFLEFVEGILVRRRGENIVLRVDYPIRRVE